MIFLNPANKFPLQNTNALNTKGLQNPIGEALGSLVESKITAQEQEEALERVDSLSLTAQLKAEGSAESVFAQMPDDLLHIVMAEYRTAALIARDMEEDLTEYREQLSAFDQSIRQYQKILDGAEPLPDHLSMDDVESLLEAVRQARELFLKDGADKLNQRLPQAGQKLVKEYGKYMDLIDDSLSTGLKQFGWEIDPDAKDIYGEIDRVLSAAHSISDTFKKGMAMIEEELRRREQKDDPYQLYFSRQKTGSYDPFPARNGISIFHKTYQAIWKILEQAAE